MADEQVSTQSATATETPQSGANSVEASIGAKLQSRSGGQAISDADETVSDPAGQAGASQTPDKEKAVDGKSSATKEPPKWDEQEEAWLKSKLPAGTDLSKLDPSNELVKQIVKNGRNAESEMSRVKAEHEKVQNQIKAREILEEAKKVPDTTKPTPPNLPKTKIEEFEEFHETILDNIMYGYGVNSWDEFIANYPAIAERLALKKLEGHQKAWESEQVRIQQEAEKKREELNAQQRFKDEMQSAKTAMENNMIAAKKKTPELDSQMEKTGVNEVLNYFQSEPIYWPKEFILSNPKLFDFFSKAANAIDFVQNLDKFESKKKQEWEASLKEKEKASLVPADDSVSPDMNIRRVLQRRASGGITG